MQDMPLQRQCLLWPRCRRWQWREELLESPFHKEHHHMGLDHLNRGDGGKLEEVKGTYTTHTHTKQIGLPHTFQGTILTPCISLTHWSAHTSDFELVMWNMNLRPLFSLKHATVVDAVCYSYFLWCTKNALNYLPTLCCCSLLENTEMHDPPPSPVLTPPPHFSAQSHSLYGVWRRSTVKSLLNQLMNS